mgnify:CR=1 FL=1
MQRFITDLEDATQNLPGAIDINSPLNAIEGFDSLGLVSLITLLDERYGVELQLEDLQTCRNVRELFELLRGRGAYPDLPVAPA